MIIWSENEGLIERFGITEIQLPAFIDKNKILKTGKYYVIVSFEFNEFTNNNPPFKVFSINIFCTSEDLSESLIEMESLRDPSKCIDFSLKFRYSKGVKKESTYLVGSSE